MVGYLSYSDFRLNQRDLSYTQPDKALIFKRHPDFRLSRLGINQIMGRIGQWRHPEFILSQLAINRTRSDRAIALFGLYIEPVGH